LGNEGASNNESFYFQQEGEIEKKEVKDVKDTPYNLPEGFTWSEIDVKDKDQIEEVYKLLTFNYVEDDDHMFRFDYSVNFLQWALCPPNYHK
jgi:glycylpeptide N-tetradecanoyltransferase